MVESQKRGRPEETAVGACSVEPPFPRLMSTAELAQLTADRGLTTRELEVVEDLSRGAPYEVICQRLGITRPTLRTHIRGAYAKLGCRNRVELILSLMHRTFNGAPRPLRKSAKRGRKSQPEG